jgi:transposase, IS5 family
MRQERTIQASIFDLFAQHEIGCELKAMSQWLDGQRQLLRLVAADLHRHGVKETGRHGLPAEAVLRCALLKQHRQLSYEELAFHLEDSASFRAFARLPVGWCPKKSVLHQTISAIQAASWEAINRALLTDARQEKLETGAMVRFDSTVSEALMHPPTDSSLLWDSVRVMVRLLRQASTLPGGAALTWRNHRRLAKRRAQAIQFSRKPKKTKLYRELIAATRATVASLRQAARQLAVSIKAEFWRVEVEHYLPLVERIIDQSERRVLAGEAVPAAEKLVSLFEPHADIIVKGGRDVQYGHKLNLATGKSGLILDAVIEAGNPADAERFLPLLERHVRLLRHAAAPGGCRRRLCQPGESGQGQGDGRVRHGLPQEARAQHRGHGQEPLGVSQAAQLPRRDRGRDLLPEARLRLGTLHLARARPLQGLCLVLGGGPQPGAALSPQVSIAHSPTSTSAAPASAGRSTLRAACQKRALLQPDCLSQHKTAAKTLKNGHCRPSSASPIRFEVAKNWRLWTETR